MLGDGRDGWRGSFAGDLPLARRRRPAGLGMLVLGSLAAVIAQRLPAALGAQDAFAEMSRTMSSLLSGLGVGFVVGSSTVVRHLQVVRTTQLDKELKALMPPAEAKDGSRAWCCRRWLLISRQPRRWKSTRVRGRRRVSW